MYLLTRPVPGIFKSQHAWQKAGLTVTCLGVVDIVSCDEPISQLETFLRHVKPALVIVTSQYAARALANLHLSTPAPHYFAVGTATAEVLARSGINAQCPMTPTSEGLLALPALKDAKNQQIAIIKGEAGRTTLSDTLSNAGAIVQEFAVYRRIIMKAPAQTNQWQWPDVKGIIATSEEMAKQLFRHYDSALLAPLPWLTVSPRVAETIRALGVSNVNVAPGASDEQLCQWIKENWE
ncbi:uroporphyrinogen-III synthase [Salinimonas sp. HHU 13199]|uniref:Uroporphyrinogen-III synthase n=1 Tax=Salinimonas profundi TaxID=2729140 RepID=A0ABR8LMP0_9ALTE|nr:uroporphyrinogen-III synthase [Salinimonas profundi]MBD3587459.1 uroporphyrinogen-III synthase [Salinimonas profundi]